MYDYMALSGSALDTPASVVAAVKDAGAISPICAQCRRGFDDAYNTIRARLWDNLRYEPLEARL